MTNRTKAQKASVLALSLFTLLISSAALQNPGIPQQTPHATDMGRPQSPLHGNDDSIDSATKATMEAQRQKFIAVDRHKKMVADADKLVQLANEIKAEVDNTTKDELSVTVVKKAGEMEKLAHDIRNRMTN